MCVLNHFSVSETPGRSACVRQVHLVDQHVCVLNYISASDTPGPVRQRHLTGQHACVKYTWPVSMRAH